MERLTNIGSNGEIWITDNDETRRFGRKESAYKKLAEYETLDEQGLLLRLPCKVGNRIFAIQSNRHYEIMEVKKIEIKHCVGFGDFCYYLEPVGHSGSLYRYYEDDFGKTVFLTQEEAEQKLKEMEV